MRLFLIGYMYCGKSTIGKKLARMLNYEFLDTDNLVEDLVGKTVEEIFKDKGETFFREKESEVLEALKKKDNIVVATGGGLPCKNNNISTIKQLGKSIYLILTPSQILSRAIKSKRVRPLLADKNDEEKLNYISDTLKERESFYKQADISISALSLTNFELEITLKELGFEI
ncbi:MAG: shikimate kinase [Bacteroidales bacterium]|nr:shikimate kinase [Bacteroidales bacterium]